MRGELGAARAQSLVRLLAFARKRRIQLLAETFQERFGRRGLVGGVSRNREPPVGVLPPGLEVVEAHAGRVEALRQFLQGVRHAIRGPFPHLQRLRQVSEVAFEVVLHAFRHSLDLRRSFFASPAETLLEAPKVLPAHFFKRFKAPSVFSPLAFGTAQLRSTSARQRGDLLLDLNAARNGVLRHYPLRVLRVAPTCLCCSRSVRLGKRLPLKGTGANVDCCRARDGASNSGCLATPRSGDDRGLHSAGPTSGHRDLSFGVHRASMQARRGIGAELLATVRKLTAVCAAWLRRQRHLPPGLGRAMLHPAALLQQRLLPLSPGLGALAAVHAVPLWRRWRLSPRFDCLAAVCAAALKRCLAAVRTAPLRRKCRLPPSVGQTLVGLRGARISHVERHGRDP
mmetsp:Transcript_87162/g.244554  ORF Transcript_87162/g.244554 Transcript_87162/m.244554 type:complete len:398 (-) Transcript_87162:21-1214(-)